MYKVFVTMHISSGVKLVKLTMKSERLSQLFYSEQLSENARNKFRVIYKYHLHKTYLLLQNMPTAIKAAAAITSTHFGGKTVAVSRPSPKQTADLTFCL